MLEKTKIKIGATAAKPEVSSWLLPAITVLGTALDITMAVMQGMSLY